MEQRGVASHCVFEKYDRKSRRELFLDEMEKVVPCPRWSRWFGRTMPRLATSAEGGPVDHAAQAND